MNPSRGTVSLVAFLLVLLAWNSGRLLLPEGEESPAFFVENAEEKIWVELGDGFLKPGVHQIYDGSTIQDVILMTSCVGLSAGFSASPIRSGEALSIRLAESGKPVLVRHWMPAARRIALGVPLHPEAMTGEDWQDLSGIGPRLAERIELDRQENGDFGAYKNLERVRGIGDKRLEKWSDFFVHR